MKEHEGKKAGCFRIFPERERKKIVHQIEQGEITRQQAMQHYDIADPGTLRSWILRYASVPENILGRSYTRIEKRQAAYRVITGEVSRAQLATELCLDLSTIKRWIRDIKAETSYGQTDKTLTSSIEITSQDQSLDDLQLKVAALETMIDIAEKELGIDIRKKSGTKQ